MVSLGPSSSQIQVPMELFIYPKDMVIVTPILHLVDICDFYLFSIRASSSWKKHMSGLSLDNYSRTIPSPQGLDMVYPSFGLLWWLRKLKNTGNAGNSGWIPGLGRSPGEGNGYPFQYSCLENSRDRGAVHGLQPMESQRLDTTE